MIGGTASVISGGKFVNGAETGAFSFIFNDWAHAYQQARAEAKAWVQRIGEAWDQYSDTINLGLNGFTIAGLFVPGFGELEAGAIIAEEALAVDEGVKSLFHYTDDAGLDGILSSKKLNPSLKANNPKDAFYGDGQYLSDIVPGTKSCAQLSRCFINNPFQGNKFKNYVEINITDLALVKGRDGVFVLPNREALDLSKRIVSSGTN